MAKKYLLTREEWLREARTFAQRKLPTEPTAYEKAEAQKGLADYGLIVYRAAFIPVGDGKKKKVVRCTCSLCGTSFDRPYARMEKPCCHHGVYTYGANDPFGFEDGGEIKKSYSQTVCPECGHKVSVIHTGKIDRMRECGAEDILTARKADGSFCLILWRARKYVRPDGTAVTLYQKHFAATVIDRRLTVFSGGVEAYPSGFSERPCWLHITSVGERRGSLTRACVILPGGENAEDGTNCEKSAISAYLRENRECVLAWMYLAEWLKHPNIENLVRQGYAEFVTGYLKRLASGNLAGGTVAGVNLRRARPREILGLSAEEFRRFRGRSFDEIAAYKAIRDYCGVCLTEEELPLAVQWNMTGFSRIERVVEHAEMPRLVRYLLREGQRNRRIRINPHYYNDYLMMLDEVEGQIDRRMLFPRDLAAAHDRLVRMKKHKTDEKINAGIRERSAAFEKYCFAADGLTIRPCATQEELISEGATLSHCVGGYAGAVSRGETMIFFVRRADDPGKPFYTLEYKNGRIEQDHGYGNRLQTEEILAFEKKWLAFVAKVDQKTKKEKKNGKRDEKPVAGVA